MMCLSLPLLSGIALSTMLAANTQAEGYVSPVIAPQKASTIQPQMREENTPEHLSPDYDAERDRLYPSPSS